jgi:hypothetical protein
MACVLGLPIGLDELKKENEQLRKQVAMLDRDVGRLEQAVGRGDYDRRTTRVGNKRACHARCIR